MNRRQFSKLMALPALLSLSSPSFSASPKKRRLLRPRRLKAGDTVGMIAPGSPIGEEELQRAIQHLGSLGLRVQLGQHVRASHGFIAGTDAQRLEDLHAMFADPSISAVWCARGGYGCSRLLPKIDYELIRRNPKILIGYSDITALIQAVNSQTGLVCFHGPVGSSKLTDYTRSNLEALLFEGAGPHLISLAPAAATPEESGLNPFKVLVPGKAQGPLAGGNLTLLAAMAGTPYQLDATGKLVFIEDIGEKPYRIDRMLTQLHQTANLHKAAGILLGQFTDCEADADDQSLSLEDTLAGQFTQLGIPVLAGFSFGHVADQCTLPVGVPAELDTAAGTVKVLEAGVD